MPGTLELNMVSEHIIDSKETKVCNGLRIEVSGDVCSITSL